ncbi:hypothetical protein HYE82_13395, partial [Streptomyces sp. BR123]|nr:hypothetical protein [Streptomyces sp. BR123]
MGGLTVHRLGAALCLAVAVLGTASAVAAQVRARAASRRITALLPAGARRRRPAVLGARIRGFAAQWWGPAGVLLAVWV